MQCYQTEYSKQSCLSVYGHLLYYCLQGAILDISEQFYYNLKAVFTLFIYNKLPRKSIVN